MGLKRPKRKPDTKSVGPNDKYDSSLKSLNGIYPSVAKRLNLYHRPAPQAVINNEARNTHASRTKPPRQG